MCLISVQSAAAEEGPHDYDYLDENDRTARQSHNIPDNQPMEYINVPEPDNEYHEIPDSDVKTPDTYPTEYMNIDNAQEGDYNEIPEEYNIPISERTQPNGQMHEYHEVPNEFFRPSGGGTTAPSYEVPADAVRKARTLASPPFPNNMDYETPMDAFKTM